MSRARKRVAICLVCLGSILPGCATRGGPVPGEGVPLEPTPFPSAPAGTATFRVPSFGAGAEVEPGSRRRMLRWLRRDKETEIDPALEASPALAAPRDTMLAVDPGMGGVEASAATVPGGDSSRVRPPAAPPTGADRLTRNVYQLQARVYGIQVLLADRRTLPQLLARIEAAQSVGAQLAIACRGDSSCEGATAQVASALARVHQFAQDRDEPAVRQVLSEIAGELADLRTVVAR